MKALVTGVAGELGSSLSKVLVEEGYEVYGVDTVRKTEAWRLSEIEEDIHYVWKDSIDIAESDVDSPEDLEVVVDCGSVSDRPFGTGSPRRTSRNNLDAPVNILETFLDYDPVFVYPATGVSMLGVPEEEQPIDEDTRPVPVNLYGWSKYAAEELYRTYRRSHGARTVVTRSGSVYGEGMRANQAVAQFIMKALNGEDIEVRSPQASRTPQYVGDVETFYRSLFEALGSEPGKVVGETLISGGNAEDRDYTVLEIAKAVVEVVGNDVEVYPGDSYEEGEELETGYVKQHISPGRTREILDWEPRYTLKEGLENTVEWFRETDRYNL